MIRTVTGLAGLFRVLLSLPVNRAPGEFCRRMSGDIPIKMVVILCLVFGLAPPVSAAKAKVDFNGSGRASVFINNVFTGEVSAQLNSGTGAMQNVSYGVVPPNTGWMAIGLSDFDGDGRTDLLFRNHNTGGIWLYTLNSGQVVRSMSVATVPPSSGWAPADLKDYNNDGRTDILWYNSTTGGIWLYVMNGGQVVASGSLGTVAPSTGWLPTGFADFNHDGSTDILWRNVKDGALYLWFVNGIEYTQRVPVCTVDPSSGWVPINVADYNGDGGADILWGNTTTGGIWVYLMNGSQIIGSGKLGTVPFNTGWLPIAAGDFNGDNSTDLLWQNTSTGGIYVWLINGAVPPQMISAGKIDPKTGTAFMGIDDYNGDGRSDIIWRNAFTDELAAWLMNGGTVQQIHSFNKLPASSISQVNVPQ